MGLSPDGLSELTVALAKTGKFTGKLVTYGTATYSLSGSFSNSGTFTGQAGKPPVPIALQLTGSTASTYVLTGSALGKTIIAYPAAYLKGQVVTELGAYTTLLSGTDPSASIPQGTSYGTVTISKTGAGSLVGKLADGTSYSASSILVLGTGGHELIVFDPNIYSKKGLLSGVLNFSAGQDTGPFLWIKAPKKGTYYAAGFDTLLAATGGIFNKTLPLPFTNGTVTLSAGGLATTGTAAFTLTAKGAGTILDANVTKAKLSVKPTTGAVTGSFVPPGGTKAISFAGLLLQDGTNSRAAGYFLGPVVSGTGYSGDVTLP